MKGHQDVTYQNLAIELENEISPISLNCDEEIETEEVDFPNPYAVTAACYVCEEQLRLAVVASDDGIRQLQVLLLDSLQLLCASCSRQAFCNRRPEHNGS
ncbi:E7 early protein [Bos taurus papillomavirus 39]|nr:E7 early protein [Bos taurus papillomavirus 39]QYI89569.1 E7 early protein [Bos taurus papillomavirus 39]